MQPVLVLLAIEATLASLALAVTRFQTDRMIALLIASTAALEVYRSPVAGFNLSLFRLSLAIGAVYLVVTYRRRLAVLLRERLVIPYAAVALAIAVSTATISDNVDWGERFLATVLIGIMAMLIFAVFAVRLGARGTAKVVALGGVLPIMAACWQSLGPQLGGRSTLPFLDVLPAAPGLEVTRADAIHLSSVAVRLRGTFGDPNHFAVYLVFVFLLATSLALLASEKHRREAICFAGLALASLAIIAGTYSRTGWAACAIGVIVYGALAVTTLKRERHTARQFRAAAVVGGVLLILLAPAASNLAMRVNPRSSVNYLTNRTHKRTAEVAARDWAHRPIFGVGVGGLGVQLGQGPRASGAHSSYLTVAAELGTVGLALMLAGAWLAAWPLFRRVRTGEKSADGVVATALLGAYAGFIVSNVVYDVWWDDFHWIILGTIIGLVHGRRLGSAMGGEQTPGVQVRGVAPERPIISQPISP
jgi:hypothetical protein